MADVFLAHQPGPFSAGKLVVIKQLRPGIVDDEQFVQMFADESRIAVRLNHPNVVHTYEVVAENGEYYLTLEFLDGKSLHQVLTRVTRESMPLTLHIWALTQVLSGLHYAHELTDFDGSPLGIVHRDVSPSNVFFTYGGEVKLLDFGIAKSVGAISATREGLIKGKLGYASPEQCLCKATDGRTDVFAVGVMLWEAIAGRKRTIGGTDASTYQARVQGSELRIDELCPSTPSELVSICNKALARDPEERYRTALEFRLALENYQRTTQSDASSEQLAEFMRDHFSNDMTELRRRIDEHLGNSRSQASRQFSGVTAQSHESAPPTGSRSGSQLGHGAAANQLGHQRDTRWYARPLVQGALGTGAVALLGLFFRIMTASEPAIGAASTTATLATPQVSAAVNPASLAQGATAPVGQISVSLVATPSTAVLRLDGRRISNPYRAAHGRDDTPHHLTAALPGYETVEQELAFNHDVDVSVSLVSLSAQRGAGSIRTAVRTPPAGSPPVASPRSGSLAAPKNATPAQPDIAQPGEDLRGSGSRTKTRDIDEMDPYKR